MGLVGRPDICCCGCNCCCCWPAWLEYWYDGGRPRGCWPGWGEPCCCDGCWWGFMASEVVETLACCCWTSVLGFEAVELRSLAGWGGDWVELFGTGDAGPKDDDVLAEWLLLLLLLDEKSELVLGLWVRLFPDAFRFEPTRLRKREGICLALHMPRDKSWLAGSRHAGTDGHAPKSKKRGQAGQGRWAGDGVCRLPKRAQQQEGGRKIVWLVRDATRRRRRVDQQRRFVTLGTSRWKAKALDNKSTTSAVNH
jgi:hypothetical protein